jgi:hypothetical protein
MIQIRGSGLTEKNKRSEASHAVRCLRRVEPRIIGSHRVRWPGAGQVLGVPGTGAAGERAFVVGQGMGRQHTIAGLFGSEFAFVEQY